MEMETKWEKKIRECDKRGVRKGELEREDSGRLVNGEWKGGRLIGR